MRWNYDIAWPLARRVAAQPCPGAGSERAAEQKGRIFTAILLAVLSFLASPSVSAKEYQFPADPVAPQSYEECKALQAQYQAIFEAMVEESKEVLRQLKDIDGYAAAKPYHARHQQILEAIHETNMAEIHARSRCEQQVAAYKRAQEAQQRQAQDLIRVQTSPAAGAESQATGSELNATAQAMASIPAGAAGAWAKRSALSLLDLYGNYGGVKVVGGEAIRVPPQLARRAIANTIIKMIGLSEALDAASARTGGASQLDILRNDAKLGQKAIGNLAGWNPLQKLLVSISVGTLFDIHSAAVQDLDTALANFNADSVGSSITARLQSTAVSESRLLGIGSNENAGDSDLWTLYEQSMNDVSSMYASRGDAAADAMRRAAELIAAAKRAREEQEANRRLQEEQDEAARQAEAEHQKLNELAAEVRRQEEFARQQQLREAESDRELEELRQQMQQPIYNPFTDAANQMQQQLQQYPNQNQGSNQDGAPTSSTSGGSSNCYGKAGVTDAVAGLPYCE